jgi:hypothetical protein
MTPEQITKTTEAQCRRFALAIGGEWHEKEFLPYVVNPITYDSPTILLKMREKLGEEKYSKFIYQLSSQYFDKNGITRIGQQARLINFLNDYIFNPAALIDKASEYLKEKGE